MLLKCRIPRATKNLDKRACIKTFPQLPIPPSPSSPVLQSSTLLIQQGCLTIASGKYLWFDVTTTLCYPFYPFGFVPYTSKVQILFSTHPSRCHKPLKQPVGNVKINLQSPHSILKNHESHNSNPYASHAVI